MLNPTSNPNRPSPASTGCWVLGLLFTYFFLNGGTPEEVAHHAAVGVGLTMVIAIGLEAAQNWRCVLRPDAPAFGALYFLTFFEFLSRQSEVDQMTTKPLMYHACCLALLAFGSMAVARHFSPALPGFLTSLVKRPTSPRALFSVFAVSFFFGIFYMLAAVNFNFFEMIDQIMQPRFTQSWSRGRFGDWKALLNQVGDLIGLVPPIAGLILARRERYHWLGILVVILGFIFCLFQDVAGGTRSALASSLVTFLIAYGLTVSSARRIEFGFLCVIAAAGFLASSAVMLNTRTIGLKSYLTTVMTPTQKVPPIALPNDDTSFFVDRNLVIVSQLASVFPSAHPFLGLETLYVALAAPIPRAIWPGKPTGLSLSMEDAIGVGSDMTVSATFIGEAYIAGGSIGVIIAGCFFGMLTAWWGRLGSFVISELGFLIYTSGFFAIVISMRSLYALIVAALPTIAAILFALLLVRGMPGREPEADMDQALPSKR
jgi:hypothetical protein